MRQNRLDLNSFIPTSQQLAEARSGNVLPSIVCSEVLLFEQRIQRGVQQRDRDPVFSIKSSRNCCKTHGVFISFFINNSTHLLDKQNNDLRIFVTFFSKICRSKYTYLKHFNLHRYYTLQLSTEVSRKIIYKIKLLYSKTSLV